MAYVRIFREALGREPDPIPGAPASRRRPQLGRASARSMMRAGVCRWALLAMAPVVSAVPAWAQETVHWDVNGTAIGEGGTGTWNETAPIWSLSTDGVSGPFRAWDNAALDDAIFSGNRRHRDGEHADHRAQHHLPDQRLGLTGGTPDPGRRQSHDDGDDRHLDHRIGGHHRRQLGPRPAPAP